MQRFLLCSLCVVLAAGCSRLGGRSLIGAPGADSRSLSCALNETRRLGYVAAGVQTGAQSFVAEKTIFKPDAASSRSLARLGVALAPRGEQWALQVDPERYSLEEVRRVPVAAGLPGGRSGPRPLLMPDSILTQRPQRERGGRRLPLGPVLGDAQQVLQACGGR